ncbi:MAG: hypothetical protein U0835_18295 [Isosphaeraceae bacterium]
MKRTLLVLGTLWLACGSPAASNAHAQVIVVFSQSGPDVVGTVSGQANLTGLSGGYLLSNSFGFISPGQKSFVSTNGVSTNFDNVVSGPLFGTGGLTQASASSGSTVGFLGARLTVPFNYVSGTSLSASLTFAGATYATLGLTPGTYTFTWSGGSFATGQALQIQILAVPEVGSLTLGGCDRHRPGCLGLPAAEGRAELNPTRANPKNAP